MRRNYPNFARGLSDCKNVNLTRSTRKFTATQPLHFDRKNDNSSPMIFGSFTHFAQRLMFGSPTVAEKDLEEGTELIAKDRLHLRNV